MPALAEILRRLRRERGLSQEGLARLADLSTASVSKLEQGEVADPSWSTVCKLADALGVSIEAFRESQDGPGTTGPRRPGRPHKSRKKGGAK